MALTVPKYTRELLIPEFIEDPHGYIFNGRPSPAVSTILDPVKENKNFYTPESRVFGKAVHLACRFYNENDLDEDELGDSIKPYLEGWKKFRRDTGFAPDLIEQPLASDRGFCGTIDACQMDFCTVDIKTGAKERWHSLQSAAYASMLPNQFIRRFTVYLNDTGVPRVEEHPKTEFISDFNVFLNCLAIHNWKERK